MQQQNRLSNFIVAAGVILAVSYPILAISTGFRAVFQVFEGDPTNSPWLTVIAALCYTVATVGFAKQPRLGSAVKERTSAIGTWWQSISPQSAWRISLYVLIFETAMTLIVGTLSIVTPELIGRNVWQFFGRDYGYFPLIQPILGILWLFNPITRQNYALD